MITKPALIDSYMNTTTNINGKWVIAKPLGWGFGVVRMYHAWLVLIGKATAVMFVEDK